jgi:hypothetical protein
VQGEPTEVEKFVNARIEIGEMTTNYFKGGKVYKDGQRPAPEVMGEVRENINAKLIALLGTHDRMVEEHRRRCPCSSPMMPQ